MMTKLMSILVALCVSCCFCILPVLGQSHEAATEERNLRASAMRLTGRLDTFRSPSPVGSFSSTEESASPSSMIFPSTSPSTTPKTSWPELIGVEGEVAVVTIRNENSSVTPIIVLEGSIVTADYDIYRVRVWVDENGFVVTAPTVG
uniref:Subtilisin inhibitor domain-containing protein n=1 Tax=Cyclophora tenuis TaxID=216820 RepID=A0A6U1RBT9_CYCTE|mmetsp:Transcript_24046/g.40859  ORF Transcript_24046/g.40859 Transcript_24046/m.40859 type:complete len:147 (+) Transcript_24046:55-495(+)